MQSAPEYVFKSIFGVSLVTSRKPLNKKLHLICFLKSFLNKLLLDLYKVDKFFHINILCFTLLIIEAAFLIFYFVWTCMLEVRNVNFE